MRINKWEVPQLLHITVPVKDTRTARVHFTMSSIVLFSSKTCLTNKNLIYMRNKHLFRIQVLYKQKYVLQRVVELK